MSFILHFSGSRHRFVRCSYELTRRKRFALRRTGFLGRDEEKLFSLTYLLSYFLNYLVTCLITFLSTEADLLIDVFASLPTNPRAILYCKNLLNNSYVNKWIEWAGTFEMSTFIYKKNIYNKHRSST